jgi:DUF4097 and DUF4098 domain-containing protein YvlB
MKTALKIVGISLVAVAVLGGAVYAAAEALEETDTHRDKVSQPADHVVVKAEAGDIDVVSGGRSVEIERTDSYSLNSPDVSQTLEDGVLTIEAECSGVFSPFCTTDFRVEVPKGVTVETRTYVGDIEVDGISARQIEARAYVGDVHIDAARKAEVDARTNVGDVDVEMPKGPYDIDSAVDADTDVGSVDVTPR